MINSRKTSKPDPKKCPKEDESTFDLRKTTPLKRLVKIGGDRKPLETTPLPEGDPSLRETRDLRLPNFRTF